MSGKARPSLRRKTLENVRFSNLSETDKQCIYAVFAEKDKVRCKDCRHNVANQTRDPHDVTEYTDIVCTYFMTDGLGAEDYCSHGERIADA